METRVIESCIPVEIREIKDAASKSKYAEMVLQSLPEWFGNEASLNDYVERVIDLPFWIAADNDGKCLGIISVKIHYGHTGDVFVMGVVKEQHNKGIGKLLMDKADEYFRSNSCKYAIVKTLSDMADYEPYENTRRFYMKCGYEPLITLTEMWDEENPCLIMIRNL